MFVFKLEISQKQRCGEIEIRDVTGTTATGWGDGTTGPDITLTTAIGTKIVFSNGAIWLGDLFDATLPFPNLNGQPTLVTKAMLGEDIPDGLVHIEATAEGAYNGVEGLLGKFAGTFFNTCHVACCVSELQTRVSGSDPCSDSDWNAWLKARELYASLLNAIACKKWSKATEILTNLKKICASNNCNCGC